MEPQFVIIVLDALPLHWVPEANTTFQPTGNRGVISLDVVWSALMAFSNALIIQNSHNRVAWFLASDARSASSFSNQSVRIVVGSLWKTVSLALAFLHKRKISARLLVVQKQAYPEDYQLALHCIIAAQQLKTTIDGIALCDSSILDQACSFTGGTFIRQAQAAVLQTLLQVFLQPKKYKQSNIFNLRPKCTCCDREVDKAFVCSACLAIYCEVSAECRACGSRFLFSEFIDN